MIRVACPQCRSRYRLDESQVRGKSRVRTKCPKCGGPIEIAGVEMRMAGTEPAGDEAPAPANKDATARMRRMRSDESIAPGEDTMTAGEVVEVLELPTDKKYSLAVLQGSATGKIFPISKARTTIGRADCDIVIDDPECSRRHAVLEILGSRNIIRDLDSTNGTIVDGKRVEEAELENHFEFRVGDHVLMLIITDRE